MDCAQRNTLIAEFDTAARRFRDASATWDRSYEPGRGFAVADKERSEARIEYELARLLLEKHIQQHGCGVKN